MKNTPNYTWTDEKVREAKRDYCEAFWWVYHQNKPGMTTKELCEACGGHNFGYHIFDLNYKHVCITVQQYGNGKLRVYKNFEYWPDPESMTYVDCNIDEFLDY